MYFAGRPGPACRRWAGAADRTALAERYAARAVELLGRARKAGYFANRYNLIVLNRETDLDPLRPRADFQAVLALIMDQGFPGQPVRRPVSLFTERDCHCRCRP